MKDDARLERIFSDALAGSAPSRAPDRLRTDIKHVVSQTRPRPRWLATLREAPMHTLSTATVGRSTARRATAIPTRLVWLLLISLLIVAIAAGGLVVGSRLFQTSVLPIPQGGAAVLAFDTDRDIFAVRADGTDLRQLTSGPGIKSHPAWSPDGTRVAYRLQQGLTNQVVVMDAVGGGLVVLDERSGPAAGFCGWWNLEWSPDGSTLAFPVGPSCRDASQVHIVKVDGSAPATSLFVPGIDSKWPTWSPDGTKVAVLGSESGGADALYVADVSPQDALRGGLVPRRLGPDLPFDYIDEPSRPQWSPDSSEVAVVAGPAGVMAVKADGSGQRTIATDDAHNPMWSRDGRLAYQRPVDESEYFNERPCTVRTWIADGSGAPDRELEQLSDGCEVPAVWSPDGTRLASLLIAATESDPTLGLHLGIVTLDDSSPPIVLPDGISGSWQPVAAPLPPAPSFAAVSPTP